MQPPPSAVKDYVLPSALCILANMVATDDHGLPANPVYLCRRALMFPLPGRHAFVSPRAYGQNWEGTMLCSYLPQVHGCCWAEDVLLLRQDEGLSYPEPHRNQSRSISLSQFSESQPPGMTPRGSGGTCTCSDLHYRRGALRSGSPGFFFVLFF